MTFSRDFISLRARRKSVANEKKKKKAEGSLVFFLYIRNCAIEGKIYHLTRATSAFRVNFPDVISDALYFARKEFADKCPQESRRKIKILFCIAREDEALVYERKLITNRHLDHDSWRPLVRSGCRERLLMPSISSPLRPSPTRIESCFVYRNIPVRNLSRFAFVLVAT